MMDGGAGVRYFLPRFKIATLAPPQTRLVSKIGGLPWGFPGRMWPKCCGHPQKLVAQLVHDPPMLDLGAPGLVLHLFHCIDCDLGCSHAGRSTVLVDQSQLGSGLTRVEGWDYKPELGESLVGELFIDAWEEGDDGIPPARLPEFFDERKLYDLHHEFGAIDWFEGRNSTRFGGSPRWTGNGPMQAPEAPYEFLFQIASGLWLEGPPPDAEDVGCQVLTTILQKEPLRIVEQTAVAPRSGVRTVNAPWYLDHGQGDNHHWASFDNLGSDGTIFVFTDRTGSLPRILWFWNR